VIKETGGKLLAHANAGARIDRIDRIDRGPVAGDVVKVGKRVELLVFDTPGDTTSHTCLVSKTDRPALICGDTMFNAGAGNCHNGGHPAELYRTFTQQLAKLPDTTVIGRLRESFPDLPKGPSPEEAFVKLRELRNSW